MRMVSETSGTLSITLKSSLAVPEEQNKRKGHEKIFERIIVKNFPDIGKEIATQVHETQRVPYRINPKRNTPRHILTKI